MINNKGDHVHFAAIFCQINASQIPHQPLLQRQNARMVEKF